MNKPLLRKVIRTIRKHPDLYHQSDLGAGDPRKCGTACCIAGWVDTLEPKDQATLDVIQRAGELLGVPISSRLFCSFWPRDWFTLAGIKTYDDRERHSPSPKEAVTILEAMLKEGGFWV